MILNTARLLTAVIVLFTGFSNLQAASARLVPTDASIGARAGAAVSVDHDTLVVGAPDDDAAGPFAGSVYVYTRHGNSWQKQSKIVGPATTGYRSFGESVGVSRNVIVVGAPFEATDGNSTGAAYVYVRTGNKWNLQARLSPQDAATNQQFGNSVAIEDGAIVVGAFLDSATQRNAGAAYVFTRSGTTWSQRAKLTASDASPYAFFGSSVAISNLNVIVGSPTVETAYVFAPGKNTWTQQALLTADDALEGDYSAFGASVSIDGNTVVVGAATEGMYAVQAGAAYVYRRSGGKWSQQRKLSAADGVTGDEFGTSVSLAGHVIAVGAPYHGDRNQGVVYVFDAKTGTPLRQIAAGAPGSAFLGQSVDCSTEAIAVGAPAFPEFTVSPAGAALVFSLH